MENYISVSLAAGHFFVAKKDKSMTPYKDYRQLSNITIKNKYHQPPINSDFELLDEVTLFTKLDLCNAYTAIWYESEREISEKSLQDSNGSF